MYWYTDEVHHGHVTLSKVSQVTEGPEAKRRKNLAAFLNRYVGGLLIGLVEFSW